ncbi:MAG: ATP-binding protein [Christensenellaceae bacterium]|jgi:PAS domain S-box-containing protein
MSNKLQQNIFQILGAAETGVWQWNVGEAALYGNDVFWGFLHLTPQSAYPLEESFQHLASEDMRRLQADLSHLANDEIEEMIFSFRLVHANKAPRWLYIYGTVIARDDANKPLLLGGVSLDISMYQSELQQLLAEKEHVEYVSHLAGLGTWEWDIANDHITFSDDYQHLTGYTPEELNGSIKGVSVAMHPDDFATMQKGLEDYIAKNEGVFSMEIRIKSKDGIYLWFMDIASIVEWDAAGNPIRMRGGLLYIDKMMRAEEALRTSLQANKDYSEKLQSEMATAVASLEQTRHTMTAMFDANPHINVLFDHQFHAIDCNPCAISFFGFSSKEALLAGLHDRLAEASPPFQPSGKPTDTMETRLLIALKEGQTEFEAELVFHHRPVVVNVVLKRIPYEGSFAIVCYMIDLTLLRQARNELVRHDRLLQSVNSVANHLVSATSEEFERVIWESLQTIGRVVGADRTYIWENYEKDGVAYCRQTYEWAEGVEPQQGKDFTIDLPYDEVPFWHASIMNGISLNGPVKDLPAEERAILEPQDIISILVIPITQAGKAWGFIGFDDCQHERVFTKAEEQVLQSAGILMVSALLRNTLMRNLVETTEIAEANTRAKSEFLSRMSHEIRTPMNAIIGMTTLAQNTEDLPKIQYYLEKLALSSRQLLSIINDVLDMSKIESGKFEISTHNFDFEKMLQHVISLVQVKMEEKRQHFQVELEGDFSREMISDELRLTQVLTNLLSNATKFTGDGGNITLRIKEVPADDTSSFLHVDVIDNGIGISKEQQSRLFTSFEQADGSITRQFGGTGLGLAICKTIIELMNGTIWVESELGQGSTFRFEVKVGWGQLHLPKDYSSLPHDLRILVVDDNPVDLEYLEKLLENFSLSCDAVYGADAFYEKISAGTKDGTPYDLVFIDRRLMGLS